MLRSSFFKTFVINLLIIALVAVMGNVIIARMHDVIKNLEIRENEAELRHNLENLTGEISSLENLMTQSRSINFFNRVLIIQKETYPSDYVNLAAMQQYLSSIAGANPDIADIIAYLGNSGIVITRYNTFIKAADFKKLYSFGGMEGDRFTAIPGEADHNRVSTYLPGGSVTASTRGKASIAFCYRIPISSMSVIRPMNFVYFLFDGTRLLNSFLNESLRRFGSFQLLDRQGQTLISYAAEGAGANASNGSAALKGGVSLELQSANKSLKIVAYLPEAYFSYVLGGIRSFANLSLIGATLLALLLCLYASWRQTAPLRQLMGYFARNGSGKPGLENEYAWLKERIQQMYARNHDIIAEVEQYQARAKTNYVERLLSNTTFSQEQYNEAESYLKSLPRPFAVAYGVISPSKLNESQQLTDVRMLTILDQIFVSLPNGSIRHSFDKNTFALLIPCEKDTGELEGVLQKTLQNINDTAPYRVVISLSGLCNDLHNINACFEQARIRYASSDTFNPLLMGASPPDGLNKGMSLRSMQHLYNCLLGADAPSALKDLKSLLLSELTIEDDIEQRYYAIRGILIQIMQETSLSGEAIHLPKYMVNTDPAKTFNTLSDAVNRLCASMQKSQASKQNHRVQDMLDYIRLHYQESGFYPDTIASHFSMSTKSLYDLFKENALASPAAYIQQLRLEHAAMLLGQSGVSSNQVGAQSGFSNFNTFYKAFKRYYGVSPSQYQEQVHAK